MNKEEIIIELTRISTPTGITCCGDMTLSDNTCDEILDFITNLEDENTNLKQELQQRGEVIDEAIKYLESYMPSYDFDHSNIQKAIDILKGDNNE